MVEIWQCEECRLEKRPFRFKHTAGEGCPSCDGSDIFCACPYCPEGVTGDGHYDPNDDDTLCSDSTCPTRKGDWDWTKTAHVGRKMPSSAVSTSPGPRGWTPDPERGHSGYAYRVTWLDDGGETDEGWYWDDKQPWSREEAVSEGSDAVASIPGIGIDYVLHVIQIEHGWPTDRDPFLAYVLLEEAESFIEEDPENTEDCLVDETRGAWSLDDDAYEALESALATAWHAWARKHRASIGLVRLVGKPEVVEARGSYAEDSDDT